MESDVPAPWVPVVGEGGVRTNENVVAYPQAIPQLHPALDSNAITDDNVVLDQTMRANVAV
jgi:hypothetical protein